MGRPVDRHEHDLYRVALAGGETVLAVASMNQPGLCEVRLARLLDTIDFTMRPLVEAKVEYRDGCALFINEAAAWKVGAWTAWPLRGANAACGHLTADGKVPKVAAQVPVAVGRG